MANGIQDFIKNYLALDERNRAIRRQNIEEVTSRANQLTTVQTLLQQVTDPREVDQLIGFVGPMFGDRGVEMLTQLARRTAPTGAVQAAGAAQRGREAATPEQQSALDAEAAAALLTGQTRAGVAGSGVTAEALGSSSPAESWKREAILRHLTGQTGGQFALGQATAGLPQGELEFGAGIGLGTRISPVQGQQLAQGWRGLDISAQNVRNQYDLGLISAFNQRAGILQQGALGEAKIMADLQAMQSRADSGAQELLAEVRKNQDLITQGNMTPAQMLQVYNSIRTLYAMLRERGYESFLDFDPVAAAEKSYSPDPLNRLLGTGRGGEVTDFDLPQP